MPSAGDSPTPVPSQIHTQILHLTLVPEESEDYWCRAAASTSSRLESTPDRARRAFKEHWFGVRTEGRCLVLVKQLCKRFDAFPPSLTVLARWSERREMTPADRRLICHWHMQLADPLYRLVTGEWLAATRDEGRPGVFRAGLIERLEREFPERWSLVTRQNLASKLLTCSVQAGVLAPGGRGLRPFAWPQVSELAFGYLLHLLRGLALPGSLWSNAWLRSVGLTEGALDDRLRRLPGIRVRRQGKVRDAEWDFPDLEAWAEETL